MENYIVGLDIGTCNVRVVIAERDINNELKILGYGQSPSTGLRSGAVINIEATMNSVKSAIEAAEMMAGREVFSVIIGIGSSLVESLNSRGFIPIQDKNKAAREINKDDIAKVIETAKAVVIPIGREVIHVVPQSYIVDGRGGNKDPTNMIGLRLEAEVHIITVVSTAVQNFNKCLIRSGYNVEGIMSKTLAQAMTVVTREERELGSILIDMGGGSTDVLVFLEGAPIYLTSIPVGGIMVTNDISVVRGISTEVAEDIKIKYGCCWDELLEEYEEVIIPGVGGRPPEAISRNDICDIIQPRIEEILNLVRERINVQTRLTQLSGNVILTGGGALMPGVVEMACKVFGTSSVRVGIPGNYGGQTEVYRSPEFATVMGLVVSNSIKVKTKDGSIMSDEKNSLGRKKIKEKIINFFKEFF